ncbi:UxaA family hydrolase [Peribacillus aracenensis]|uniref:UxaA family hydrolase n=1 Tax=Peribacillus aracenensis TaxID=2976708 RepID=UPI0021A7CCEE|nr:UxaA family hydrolase [Peribacillus sp. BBB004]
MENRYNALRLNHYDNIAVALKNISIGEKIIIQGLKEEVITIKDIPYGHKVALNTIQEGEKITKYGECMGISTEEILEGDHVHVRNVRGLNENERLNIINQPLK